MSPAPPIAAPPPAGAILFAGGGSGGHLSPGLAVAERLEPAGAGAAIRSIFVCSERSIDTHMLRAAGAEHVAIPARPPSRHPVRGLSFLLRFRRSVRRCRELCRTRDVRHVVALGGFVAAPAVVAARAIGVPTTLLNLDHPPGRANRWMARRCDRVWSAVALPSRPGFAERVTGMPIRRQAVAPDEPGACRAALGLDRDRPTLLVTGASQGASSLNGLLVALADTDAALFSGWQVCHLTGRGADEPVRHAYERRGVRAHVVPFLDHIGLAWGAADLAVSRAGASAVAEIAANGVPALFLPYPHHRDRHQHHNARPLVDLGGALVVDDGADPAVNVARAGPVLGSLMTDPARRGAMRERLLAHRPPDAAGLIAALLRDDVEGGRGSGGSVR